MRHATLCALALACAAAAAAAAFAADEVPTVGPEVRHAPCRSPKEQDSLRLAGKQITPQTTAPAAAATKRACPFPRVNAAMPHRPKRAASGTLEDD